MTSEQHLADPAESFGVLRHYQMKLNPTKSVFRISSGKFLGLMVNRREIIEANLDKIKVVLEMESQKKI